MGSKSKGNFFPNVFFSLHLNVEIPIAKNVLCSDVLLPRFHSSRCVAKFHDGISYGGILLRSYLFETEEVFASNAFSILQLWEMGRKLAAASPLELSDLLL